MFLAPWFAIAGLAAAAGPVVIHLFSRRRFRVVHWAAMDFLREAMAHSRRMLRLRDALLLMLRILAILAFALAMARPFFSRETALSSVDQPVHGIVAGAQLLLEAVLRVQVDLDRQPIGQHGIHCAIQPGEEVRIQSFPAQRRLLQRNCIDAQPHMIKA